MQAVIIITFWHSLSCYSMIIMATFKQPWTLGCCVNLAMWLSR